MPLTRPFKSPSPLNISSLPISSTSTPAGHVLTTCRATSPVRRLVRRSATNASSVCLRRFSKTSNRVSMDNHRLRYHVGRDEHLRFFLSHYAQHVASHEHTVSCTRFADDKGRNTDNKQLMCRLLRWATTVQLQLIQAETGTIHTVSTKNKHTRGLGLK